MKISSQIFKLLIATAEQAEPNIAYSVLKSELGKEIADSLIQNDFLTKGRDLESYYLPSQDRDVYVDWDEEMESFVYLSDLGKFLPVPEDELKTFDINFTKLTDFIADQFDVSKSGRKSPNNYLDDLLFFIGEENIQKKKYAIFFARRLNNQIDFKKIDEFFLSQSPTKFPKLILTSSNEHCPSKFTQKSKIISIPKLLTFSKDNLFNIEYISNVLIRGADDEFKPYIRCTEDAGTLFVGDNIYEIGGDKQRQIIKIMCDSYLDEPQAKVRWRYILDEANMEEDSKFRDIFKKSKVAEALDAKDGFVWFKTE